MDLSQAPESSNVEDRRGMKATGGLVAGGGGLLILVIGLLFGVDLNKLGIGGGGRQQAGPPPNDKYDVFAKRVMGTLESVWQKEFAKPANGYAGADYEPPQMVLFTAAVNTGCGQAPSSVGPFYCPRDGKIYIDPTFFAELESQLGGSKAEFSQAYVMAHEFGHHLQNLLGYSEKVDRRRGRADEKQMSVRLELQADYLAGVWAHHADRQFKILQGGDLEAAIKSANAIGDDKLQKRQGGFAHPEQYTHGTARQRVAAFTAGYKSGDASKAKLDRFFTVGMNRDGELDDALFR